MIGQDTPGTTPEPHHVWVCGACGKTSRTRYGFDEKQKRCASPGWDESCMMNAVLCHATTTFDGKYTPVESTPLHGTVQDEDKSR